MESWKFAVFGSVVLLASIGTVSSERLVCPVNSQSFISTSRTLLPLENIQSTSESSFNPTSNFVNRGDGESPWCTAPNLSTVVGQHVELNFTEPVVVGLLMSGGFVSTYVSNFTVHFTMSSTEDDYEVYGSLRPTQDFLVPDLRTANANFVLGEQILARRLKFVVNDGMLNQQDAVCWKMLLYGCTMSQAQEEIRQQVGAPSTTNTPLTDNLPTTSPLAVSMPDPMDCTKQREETQGSLLLIVLPAIIALILIVIVIVAILLCICFLRVHNQKKLEYIPSREEMSSGRTKEEADNGTTTPSSFHYDNPRFLCYDVPRTSIRSRQNSESMSTLGSVAEIRNPVYAAKRSLQDYHSPSPTYHIPPEDDANDYEDIPGTKSPTELEKRTFSNTSANFPSKPAPPILSKQHGVGGGVILDGPQSPTSLTNVHYSQVQKLRSKEKDEMEQETSPSPPPVINSHYDGANNALVQEIDRLVNDLENSRAIAKQW